MNLFSRSPSVAAIRGEQAGELASIRKSCVGLEILITRCEQQIKTLAALQDELVTNSDLLPIIGELAFQKEKLKLDLTRERKTQQELISQIGDEIDIIEDIIQRRAPKYKSSQS